MEDYHMLPSEQPPSYAQSHDSRILNLPSVPKTPLLPMNHERTLPPLHSSVPENSYRPAEPVEQREQYTPWPSTNPLTAYYQSGPSQASPISKSTVVADSPTAMDIDVATPDSRGRRGGSVLSMDDPDVRIAAEALGDLRAADFVQSPPQRHTPLTMSSPTSQPQQPEPLLSLLTTSHPLLGNAIGGSLSAYSASKNYSPRFKYGAEYVERRFTPVVNTVGSVGRVTGVEGGVRWFLGERRPSHQPPSDLESSDQGFNKKRKAGEDLEMYQDQNVSRDPYPVNRQEIPLEYRERRPSQVSTVESLPAYDDHRSPSYEANAQALVPSQPEDSAVNPSTTWQSRLIMSTSGLSVAMSEESLRSLKYCLSWLRWANQHIGKVITALKNVLEQYDGTSSSSLDAITNDTTATSGPLVLHSSAERNALNARIAELKSDVLKTLKDVVDVVSKYAGGALPENARILVRRHLTSLPQRFKLANTSSARTLGNGEGDEREGARRVMVLAKEGLDMMAQVSGVLDGTIVSAEEWCERLGRKNRGEPEEGEVGRGDVDVDQDVKMG